MNSLLCKFTINKYRLTVKPVNIEENENFISSLKLIHDDKLEK
jgi:hypothetical protein